MVLRTQVEADTAQQEGVPRPSGQPKIEERPDLLANVPSDDCVTDAFPDRAIVLIESRQLIRDGIWRCLESGLARRVFAVSSVAECAAKCAKCDSAIAILSTLGNTDDTIATEQLAVLTGSGSGIATIIVGDHDDAGHVLRLLNLGARGFIPTSMPLAVAVQAIKLVAAGGCFVPSSSLLSCVSDVAPLAKSPQQSPSNVFTRRQAAVIEALRKGKANKIIAYELNMCESTVKVHVRNIMKKLNAKNRTEVAYRAHELLMSNAS